MEIQRRACELSFCRAKCRGITAKPITLHFFWFNNSLREERACHVQRGADHLCMRSVHDVMNLLIPSERERERRFYMWKPSPRCFWQTSSSGKSFRLFFSFCQLSQKPGANDPLKPSSRFLVQSLIKFSENYDSCNVSLSISRLYSTR